MAKKKDQDEEKSEGQLILIVRHGVAEDRDGQKPDSERSLTKTGHARMKDNARGLAELFPKIDVIYSSPWLRALQTALWISKAFGKQIDVEVTEMLSGDHSGKEVATYLQSVRQRRVVVVGHEPNLTGAMLEMCRISGETLELKKGGCYVVRGAGKPYFLDGMLNPRILRRLADR